nr:carcinoembryonic antigen-related cell adhesion molecule 19 isoform X3 [Equus caballus]
MLDKVARVGPACPVGVAQPDAARTVVLITAVATASHPSGKERLRESRKPQGVHSHPGKLVQPVSESVPGSTGEAREPVESGRWGSAGLGHVSKGPPRFPLSWPTADSQGPALGPPPCPAGDPLVSPQDAKMETPVGAQCCFSKGLLLSASILVLWAPQGSWAALHIQKIPEHPQKNQDLLLSVQGVPETFQDFNWYLGEDAYGGTRLFTYIPGLQRPQRDGSAMGQRDIVGFPNGSMLLRRTQPGDSGTYQVAVTVNPAWTMRAKTEVQVAEKHQELPITQLPMSAGIMAAIIIGSLAAGSLFIGIIAYILVTRGWRSQSHRASAPGAQGSLSALFPAVPPVPSTMPTVGVPTTEKRELGPSRNPGDNNIYEVMPSPVLLVSPLSDTGLMNMATPPAVPLPPPPEPESHHYQDLLNPDPAPYCQLVPAP